MASEKDGSQNKSLPRVLVVIVDYLKGKQLLEVVGFLRLSDYPQALIEVVVLDNSVDRKNADHLQNLSDQPSTNVEICAENIGYTAACNKGARMKESDYILLLNPDVCLRDQFTLARMVAFLEQNPGVVICGPRQVNPDGSVAETARCFPSFYELLRRRVRWANKSPHGAQRRVDHTKTQSVDWLQSSCMLVRRGFWDAVGGLDELYFLFMSDIEICLQARRAGKKVHFLSNLVVFPDGVRASRGGFSSLFHNRPFRLHVVDALRFFLRHGFRSYS